MRTALITAAALAVSVGNAHAQFVTFGFTDLDGSYDTTTQEYVARAVDFSPLHSGGDVSLLESPGGTAEYDAGFLGLGTSADAVFEMTISPRSATTALGSGTAWITDANGDRIILVFRGTWTDPGNGYAFFDGYLIRPFIDSGDQDGEFNGPSGGSFSLAGLNDDNKSGAISFLMPITNGFFTDDFAQNVTLVDGIIEVPSPAGVTLLALGGMAIRRRR